MDWRHRVTNVAVMETKMTLKLLVKKSSNEVLFAEAGKEFVDFLFSLFTLPVGAVVKLLYNHSMVGCLGELYESVENLSTEYIQPDKDKNLLLSPPTLPLPNVQNRLLLQNYPAKTPNKYYGCNNYTYGYHNYFTDVAGTLCPSCKSKMTVEIEYVVPGAAAGSSSVVPGAAAGSSSKGSGGFVMGAITYTVMDDLVVTPMSTISTIALLHKFSIKNVGALEEKVVEVGMKEGLALLNASLHSKTVLTDVFMSKKVRKTL